jgi:hypothetical protein
MPALLEIEEPNRQQLRRVARASELYPVLCSKCRLAVTVDDVCFADGADCHRSCAEIWNHSLLEIWDELKEQDKREAMTAV